MDDELDGQILGGSRQSFCRECGFSINVLGPNLGGSRLPFYRDLLSARVLQQPLPLSNFVGGVESLTMDDGLAHVQRGAMLGEASSTLRLLP